MNVINIIRNFLSRLFGYFGNVRRAVLQDNLMEGVDASDGNCVGRDRRRNDDDDEDQLDVSENPNNAEIYVPVSNYAQYYKMDHARRGLALIFNHQDFVNCSKRHGTHVDRERLKKCFEDLHFEVQVFNDLKYWEIRQQIQRASRRDHSDCDCFVLTVLTHGSPNRVCASDGQEYDPQEVIFDEFTADRCPTLAGKPKIFIMQACQGKALDQGIQVSQRRRLPATEFDGGFGYSIPVRADLLIVYATSKGHYAFRNTLGGSYFVTVLCEELINNAAKHDILYILTIVNQRVAVEFESSNTRDAEYHNKKQMPYFQSHLTRFVHFGNYKQKEIMNADPMIYSTRSTRNKRV